MFLTFSCVFSTSKQIYHQLQKNPNSSKPKFSIPNKKKIHQIRDQPKIREQTDRRRDRPRGGSTQSKQIDDSTGRSRGDDLGSRSEEWV